MADISYKYRDNEHRINSYDSMVATYDWLKNALGFISESQTDLTLNCIILFDSEDMSYECKSIDEFKKYAFGKTIRIKYMNAYLSKNWIQTIISIYANCSSESGQQEFILSSQDEMLIIRLREALLAKKKATSHSQSPTVIQYKDNSVHIGDNNKISNSTIGPKNTIETEFEISNPTPEKGKMLSNVFWKFFVPVFVIVAGALICAWLGINAQT